MSGFGLLGCSCRFSEQGLKFAKHRSSPGANIFSFGVANKECERGVEKSD